MLRLKNDRQGAGGGTKRTGSRARHENQQIEPIQSACGIVSQADGVVPSLLTRLGARSETLSQEIEKEIGRLPKVQGFGQQHMGRPLNAVLERAFKEATALKTSTFRRSTSFLHRAQDRDPPDNAEAPGRFSRKLFFSFDGRAGNATRNSQNPEALMRPGKICSTT